MVAQTIAHYRIPERLGEGEMGVVYFAEPDRERRLVFSMAERTGKLWMAGWQR